MVCYCVSEFGKTSLSFSRLGFQILKLLILIHFILSCYLNHKNVLHIIRVVKKEIFLTNFIDYR